MPRQRGGKKRTTRPPARTQKHRAGRPSKYSAAVARKICAAVAKGCSREAAAALARVNPATLYDWQRKFSEFSEGLEKADARFEAACVASIRKAGRSARNWTANSWLLERKFPHRYGKIDRHVVHADKYGAALPSDFIKAIQRALGMTGKLKPLGRPPVARTLPSGANTAALPDLLDVEVMDVLPQ